MERVIAHAARAAFGQLLVTNTLRSMVVEAMLDLALLADWRWCAADFAGWDFEHADGTRLEVKQSAARQTWAAPLRPSRPSFDIAQRLGYWEGGSTWVEGAGRHAHIYVFAHHPAVDAKADHRDPQQWDFYVAGTEALPATKSISLARVREIVPACGYADVRASIEVLRVQRQSLLGSPPSRG